MATSLLSSPIFFFFLLQVRMNDINKLAAITFFFVGVVAKKVIADVVTFFKCFVTKKAMVY
jgi:hypothetical protein